MRLLPLRLRWWARRRWRRQNWAAGLADSAPLLYLALFVVLVVLVARVTVLLGGHH